MKNFSFLFLSLLSIAVMVSSCKKSDTVAPYITLEGDNPMTITLNDSWEDPGAKATDNYDKDITSRIIVTHDIPINGVENGEGPTKETGKYTVTYSVSDDAGNNSVKNRTVNVKNGVDKYMGDYDVDRTGNNVHIAEDYTQQKMSLSSDKKSNMMFRFPKLSNMSGFRADAYVNRDIEGNSISYTVPGGYPVNIVTEEKIQGDTLWYKISGYKDPTTQKQASMLDTTGTEAKYYFLIKYNIEVISPFDPDYTPQDPVNEVNKEVDVVTEHYYFKY